MLASWLDGLRLNESSASTEAGEEDGEPPSADGPSILQVTDHTFTETILESPQPVLVEFWAPWSGPCRQVNSLVTSLAAEFHGRVVMAQLNVEENPCILERMMVSKVPTLILFKEGQEVMRLAGEMPKGPLRSKLVGVI